MTAKASNPVSKVLRKVTPFPLRTVLLFWNSQYV